MTRDVLDASALLALLTDERGADVVAESIDGAAMSTVNWSEVCRRLLAHGADIVGLRDEVAQLGLELVAFSAEDAEAAAVLWPETRFAGLSLGDRACLALAGRLARAVLTADRAWLALDVGVEIRSIR